MEDVVDTQLPTIRWNNEEAWVTYVTAITPQITAIATKYTADFALREDAVQNALIELLMQHPEEIRGFEDFCRGEITEDRWQDILLSYCLTVARNEILSTLSSHTTGNIYVGRTQVRRVERLDGTTMKVKTHIPARYVSLDQLVEESGLQVSEHGDLSWDSLNEVKYDGEDS